MTDLAPPRDSHPVRSLVDRVAFLAPATALLFLGAWIAWFVPFDDLLDRSRTPLGGDYPMFYLGGRMVLEGGIDRLYDQAEHLRRFHELFPGLGDQACLPYRYPPFVAIAFAPLAWLPYGASWFVFTGISLGALATVIVNLRRSLPMSSPDASRLLMYGWLCWPVVLETLVGGQASLIACALIVVVDRWRREERWLAAGLILSLAAYKPNVLAFVALGLLIRFPRLWFGWFLGTAGLLLTTFCLVGGEPILAYAGLATDLSLHPWTVETPFWKQHGLGSWLACLVPGHEKPTLVALGTLLVVVVALRWRTAPRLSPSDAIAMTTLLTINGLFNPYVPLYDLALLGVAAAWLAGSAEFVAVVRGRYGSWIVHVLFAFLFFGPHLSQALSLSIGWQVFPIGLAALLVWELCCIAVSPWDRLPACQSAPAR